MYSMNMVSKTMGEELHDRVHNKEVRWRVKGRREGSTASLLLNRRKKMTKEERPGLLERKVILVFIM